MPTYPLPARPDPSDDIVPVAVIGSYAVLATYEAGIEIPSGVLVVTDYATLSAGTVTSPVTGTSPAAVVVVDDVTETWAIAKPRVGPLAYGDWFVDGESVGIFVEREPVTGSLYAGFSV